MQKVKLRAFGSLAAAEGRGAADLVRGGHPPADCVARTGTTQGRVRDGVPPAYEPYALRYARRAGTTDFIGRDPHDALMPMESPSTLIAVVTLFLLKVLNAVLK